jgi:hypothetical protein
VCVFSSEYIIQYNCTLPVVSCSVDDGDNSKIILRGHLFDIYNNRQALRYNNDLGTGSVYQVVYDRNGLMRGTSTKLRIQSVPGTVTSSALDQNELTNKRIEKSTNENHLIEQQTTATRDLSVQLWCLAPSLPYVPLPGHTPCLANSHKTKSYNCHIHQTEPQSRRRLTFSPSLRFQIHSQTHNHHSTCTWYEIPVIVT